MKLCDITDNLYEDDNNPVDQELDRTAANIKKKGSLDPKDIKSEDDLDKHDDNFSSTDKNVDPKLLALVRNNPYITNYTHDSDDNTSPLKIMTTDLSDLYSLRNNVIHEINKITINNVVGAYSNENYTTLQALLGFVDRVMGYKKKIVKSKPPAAMNKKPVKVKEPMKTNNKAGKVKIKKNKNS